MIERWKERGGKEEMEGESIRERVKETEPQRGREEGRQRDKRGKRKRGE